MGSSNVVFDGRIDVHYGQFYVHSTDFDGGDGDLNAAFAGQSNGLCGAAVEHALSLLTGLHTGSVGLTVEVRTTEPTADDSWEDVVEVSFSVGEASNYSIVEWEGDVVGEPIELAAGDYRARYSAHGMDAGRGLDTGDGPDKYLLQIWPAAIAPDRVVKQTSESAEYWHSAWSD
ncbi:hypothetical protein [Rhodococcoides kyotonense]|uniref:Uncharacterized protein n=1 Tax=Rhodococcoides kyotonense TaxID=398843 RepID=A0A239J1X5_9NOCA|nr:hypothetical protein [Rhodococcus kyotonensis]SNS99662.1 hypothetical protein SAMN05421642_1084 [Rhodococcus kyotonensis]